MIESKRYAIIWWTWFCLEMLNVLLNIVNPDFWTLGMFAY